MQNEERSNNILKLPKSSDGFENKVALGDLDSPLCPSVNVNHCPAVIRERERPTPPKLPPAGPPGCWGVRAQLIIRYGQSRRLPLLHVIALVKFQLWTSQVALDCFPGSISKPQPPEKIASSHSLGLDATAAPEDCHARFLNLGDQSVSSLSTPFSRPPSPETRCMGSVRYAPVDCWFLQNARPWGDWSVCLGQHRPIIVHA